MTVRRISIFPLGGAILLPEMQLPLHIFEPRYRALVGDTSAAVLRLVSRDLGRR